MSGGALEVRSEVEIDAPVDVAWRVLCDLPRWSRWDPSVIQVDGALRPVTGEHVKLRVRSADGRERTAEERVVGVDESSREFSWEHVSPLTRLRLLSGRRTMALRALSAERCVFSSFERFGGPLARLVPRHEVLDGFERMSAAFKRECERVARGDASSSSPPEPIPALPGALPVVGHFPWTSLDALGFYRKAAQRGPLCWIDGGFGVRSLLCTELEVFELFKNKTTSSSYLRDIDHIHELFNGSLLELDGSEHRRTRSALNGPFMPRGLAQTGVGALAASRIEGKVRALQGRRRVKLLAEYRELALEIVMGIVGIEASDLTTWRTNYERAALLAINVPIDAPGMPVRLGREARRWLHRRLLDIVRAARERSDEGTMLGALVRSKADDGTLLTDEEVTNNLIFLLFAGHETSASTMAWATVLLARHPAVWAEVRREALAAEAMPQTPQDLAKLPYATAVFRETLRLYPPVVTSARKATTDFELSGRVVPKGTLVTIPLIHLSRHPELYSEPDAFKPERWLGRAGPPSAIELAPFGGGPHFCLGYHLAWLELVQLIVALGRRCSPSGPRLEGGFPAMRYLPLLHPAASAAVSFDGS